MKVVAVAMVWVVLAALPACSGKSTRGGTEHPPEMAEAGSNQGGDGWLPGVGGSGGDSGTYSTAGSSDSAGAGGGGDAPLEGPTVLCQDDRDCLGESSCVGIEEAKQRACLTSCNSDLACPGNSECTTLDERALGCAFHCEWPWDCEFAFDCIKNFGSGDYVCVPAQWSPFILNQAQ